MQRPHAWQTSSNLYKFKRVVRVFGLICVGIEDIYKPTWFTYQLMESFLLPIYTYREAGLKLRNEASGTEMVNEAKEIENVNSLADPSTSAATVPSTTRITDNPRRRPTSVLTEKQIATAFDQLKHVLTQHRSKPSDTDTEEM
ncbi:hypothetical protein EVAR_59429_1 [Eumeta japonica]|uniref:Uncharacterized protein n=1 Tax=Eumeta variegata TaxID=151549 RepID=A0A4C1ZML8_EUMVA|nr:hypothetical protein EVAR_59429_1 [Eumeta japonica]